MGLHWKCLTKCAKKNLIKYDNVVVWICVGTDEHMEVRATTVPLSDSTGRKGKLKAG